MKQFVPVHICPHCESETSATLLEEGHGVAMLCNCPEALREFEQKHHQDIERRKQIRSEAKRRLNFKRG